MHQFEEALLTEMSRQTCVVDVDMNCPYEDLALNSQEMVKFIQINIHIKK